MKGRPASPRSRGNYWPTPSGARLSLEGPGGVQTTGVLTIPDSVLEVSWQRSSRVRVVPLYCPSSRPACEYRPAIFAHRQGRSTVAPVGGTSLGHGRDSTVPCVWLSESLNEVDTWVQQCTHPPAQCSPEYFSNKIRNIYVVFLGMIPVRLPCINGDLC